MNVKRFVLAAALPLFCAGLARADAVTSPFFFIELSDWQTGPPPQTFNVQGFSTTLSTGGFTEGSFCPSPYSWECYCDDDPETKLNAGGDAVPFTGSSMISFTTNPTTVDYENVGFNLESITITTTISGAELNELFTCTSNIFGFCGFMAIDPPHTTSETLEILFTNGDIPSAVPEPRQYLLLLIAFGACVAADRLRRLRVRA